MTSCNSDIRWVLHEIAWFCKAAVKDIVECDDGSANTASQSDYNKDPTVYSLPNWNFSMRRIVRTYFNMLHVSFTFQPTLSFQYLHLPTSCRKMEERRTLIVLLLMPLPSLV